MSSSDGSFIFDYRLTGIKTVRRATNDKHYHMTVFRPLGVAFLHGPLGVQTLWHVTDGNAGPPQCETCAVMWDEYWKETAP